MIYSVLTEPVIPVLWLNGKNEMVGIRDAILHSHEFRDIQGDTPLERYALIRLLIAFVMDMLHPEDSYARKDIYDDGCFDASVLDDYIALCEKDGPRFDLFDPDHPFLQSKYNDTMDSKAKKPVALIIHSLPSGNNHMFIDHRNAQEHAVTYDKAFRALTASYVFCVSGTAGPSSVNNTPPVYTIIVGGTLFETIVMNMLSEAEVSPLDYGTGLVPWRSFPEVIPDQPIADVSLLEGLTWMPRRITLFPEEDHTVRRVCCQAGLDFRGNDKWNDPHVPRFKKKDGTYGTTKPELGRELWRDVGTLLYDNNGTTVRQPQVLRCCDAMYDDERPLWTDVRATGLITNNAAYIGWYEDELNIPSSLLQEQEKADLFRQYISIIEGVQMQLYRSIQQYVDKPREKSKSNEHAIASQCQLYFLKAAHELLFGATLNEIMSDKSEKDQTTAFCNAVKENLQETFQQILRKSGNDVKSIMQQMEAEKWIMIAYSKIKKERGISYV